MEKFIKIFKSFLNNEGKYDEDDVIYEADKIEGAANFVDYIIYWRGVVDSAVIEKAGEKCPELLKVVKELGIKY